MAGIDLGQLKKADKITKQRPATGIMDLLNRDIVFSARMSDKKKEAFYLELSILLAAGVDIKTAFELITEGHAKEKDRNFFERMKERIVGGTTLSEAMQQTGFFSAYEYHSIQIGEETGKLHTVLKELARFYREKIRQRRQLISALTYPAVVILTSVGAIFFMLNFIVPMFEDIFKRFGGDLPWITAMILNISAVFATYFYLFILIVIAGTVFILSQRKKEWFRKHSIRLVLNIPLIGEVIRKIYLSRFCHAMTLLIGSRIPMLRAISLTRQMINFYPVETALAQVETDVLKGMPLHQSLSNFLFFPKRMISLIKVGEEVNQLDLFFNKIADQYHEEVEYQAGVLSTLIEPFIIIFLGLIVGIILVAMYLPLFQLSSTF